MDFSSIPIKQLIPQRPPFLFVDRVISCNETDALTEYSIVDDGTFMDSGVLSAPGIVENMAQSCAARMGCVDMMHGEPIKIGFIGGVRNAIIKELPKSGDVLHTSIHVIEDIFNLLLADVQVMVDERIIATASIKVAKTDIVANLNA